MKSGIFVCCGTLVGAALVFAGISAAQDRSISDVLRQPVESRSVPEQTTRCQEGFFEAASDTSYVAYVCRKIYTPPKCGENRDASVYSLTLQETGNHVLEYHCGKTTGSS